MNVYIKRLISFLLIMAMVVSIAGCNSTSETPSEDRYANSKKLAFYTDNTFNYNIIKSSELSLKEASVVKSTVFSKARALNKVRPTYLTDTDEYDKTQKCIYIGTVDNEISKLCNEKLQENDDNYYDYIIMVHNGNIAIDAISESGLETACNYFVENILTSIDSTIYDNYLYHYKTEDTSKIKIAGVGIMNYAIVCDTNPSGMVYLGCEELKEIIKEYDNYDIPIVCGESDYKHQIKVVLSDAERDDYSIKYNNGILEITAGHSYSLNAAIHNFCQNLQEAIKSVGKNHIIDIPKTYSLSGKYDKDTYGTNGYKLVWADEFDGDKLDEHFWHAEYYEDNGVNYNKDTVSVIDGCAVITCEPTTLTDGTPGYTGGDVKGQNMEFNYGYFEARAKLPVGTGTGVSFWALGTRTNDKPYAPEIDVIETFGKNNYIVSNLHSWWKSSRKIKGLVCSETQQLAGHIQHLNNGLSTDGFSGGNGYSKEGITTMADDFHTFACEWTPTYVKFFMDGYCYTTVDITSNLTHPTEGYKMSEYMFFTDGSKMHLAFGSGLGATLNFWDKISESTEIPSKYYVDYIHLYQMPGVGEIEIN